MFIYKWRVLMKHLKSLIMVFSVAFIVVGCAAMTEEQKAMLGKTIGAVGGGAIVANLTKNIDSPFARAAIIMAGAAAGAYIGDQFAQVLSANDQKKLFSAQQQAAATGRAVSFSGEQGVRGRVSVVRTEPYRRQNKRVNVKILKDRVEKTPPLKLVGAAYSPNSRINVRSGPGTDYRTVAKIARNEPVQVIGEALPDKKWFLISQLPDGTAGGYVYSSLMHPTSQPVRYTQTSYGSVEEVNVQASSVCKTVRQEVTTSKGVLTEDIRVCQQGNGTWKLA